MKIGKVKFTWRAHRQAFAIKIGGEQRVFRFNKKTARKELFAKIRSLIAEASGTQKVCQHCGKHYFGVNSHNFLCGDCAQKAADIHREGVGNIKEFSFSEALQYIPEALADFIDAKNEGGATLFNAAIKIATNNKNKEGKHYTECYEIVKAYIKEHADFAKELQAYMQQQYR